MNFADDFTLKNWNTLKDKEWHFSSIKINISDWEWGPTTQETITWTEILIYVTFCRQLAALITHSVSCATIRRKSLHFTYIPLTLLYGMYWCTSFRLHWIIQHLDCCRLTFVLLLAKDFKKKWRYHFFENIIIGIQQMICVAYLIQILKKIATYVVFCVQGASFFAVYLHISIPITYIYILTTKTWIENVNGQWRRSTK